MQIAYAVIPKISSLQEPLKSEVRAVFARATRLIWQVMIGISGAGLLTVFLMREERMRGNIDEQWGLQEKSERASGPESDSAVKLNGLEPEIVAESTVV